MIKSFNKVAIYYIIPLQHYNQGGNRMISPDEEAVYGAQHSKHGAPPIAQEPRNAGYMTNLDSFSRTLENWHLRS